MDFHEFVEKLYEAGWIARNDAQWTGIRQLWSELLQEGIKVHLPLATDEKKVKIEVEMSDALAPPGVTSGQRLNMDVVWVLVEDRWYQTKYRSIHKFLMDFKSNYTEMGK